MDILSGQIRCLSQRLLTVCCHSLQVKPASDVWAFGCCLWAWMTGRTELPIGLMREMAVNLDRALVQVINSVIPSALFTDTL